MQGNTFQSTFPSRGTTKISARGTNSIVHFNPRSPRGERPDSAIRQHPQRIFQSTFPSRGTTNTTTERSLIIQISIHVPLAGNDCLCRNKTRPPEYFNPRSPRGERHAYSVEMNDQHEFQSTFPSRGTTKHKNAKCSLLNISIHVPLAGNDVPFHKYLRCILNFNPRSPRGERHKM